MAYCPYQAIVIGVSAGGMAALRRLLPALPASFPVPILIVQHLHPHQDNTLIEHLDEACNVRVKEAEDKEPLQPGYVYFAPPNYHLLVEHDHTLALSVDAKVNYSRPSVDVLFESAVDVFGARLIGIVLTGANNDGAEGLRRIKARGGLVIAQDPATAEVPYMPQAAIQATAVDHVLPLDEMGALLAKVCPPPDLA